MSSLQCATREKEHQHIVKHIHLGTYKLLRTVDRYVQLWTTCFESWDFDIFCGRPKWGGTLGSEHVKNIPTLHMQTTGIVDHNYGIQLHWIRSGWEITKIQNPCS